MVDGSCVFFVGGCLLVVGFDRCRCVLWLVALSWLIIVCCGLLVVSWCSLVVTCWLFIFSCLVLIVGCWLLVVGCRPLVVD